MRVENSSPKEWKTIKIDEWNENNNKANDCLSNIIMNNYGVEYGTDDYFKLEKELMELNENIYGKGTRNTVGSEDRRDTILYDGEEFKLVEFKKAPSANNPPPASETANTDLKPGKFDNTKTNDKGQTPEQIYNETLKGWNENSEVKVSKNDEGKITWECQDDKDTYIRTFNEDGSYLHKHIPKNNPGLVEYYEGNEFFENVSGWKYECSKELKPEKFDNNKKNENKQTPEEYYSQNLFYTNRSSDGGVKVSKNDKGKITWDYVLHNVKYNRVYNDDGSYTEEKSKILDSKSTNAPKQYDAFGNEQSDK